MVVVCTLVVEVADPAGGLVVVVLGEGSWLMLGDCEDGPKKSSAPVAVMTP